MTLFPFERRWAAAIGRALVPAGALGGSLDQIDIGARYAEECAISPWYVALIFRASLWLTWLAPLWLLGRAHTFAGVDDETRVVVLERLLKHPRYTVRMAGLFLKLTLCGLLLGDEPTLARIGAYKLRKSA
ncbi:MAG TPA: hypothetical protein VF334_19545 [Polyangia bacterium]